jgi:predicted cation transporter
MMSTRTARHARVLPIIALLAMVALSGQALADATLLKDDFNGADGSAPDSDRWALEGVDPTDIVSVQGGALEVNGSATVRSRETLTLHTLEVLVDVSVLNASGQSAVVTVLSVFHGETVDRVSIWYAAGLGWVFKTVLEERVATHVEPRTAVIGAWYTVAMSVEGGSANVTVTPRDNASQAWSYEADIDPLAHQCRLGLGVNGSRARFDTVRIITGQWQENPVLSVGIGLFVILIVVLLGPFLVKKIEHQLEAFLFVMGVIAVSLDTVLLKLSPSGGGGHGLDPVWSLQLVEAGLMDPLKITAAVLIAGLMFHYFHDRFKVAMERAIARLSLSTMVFIIVVVLGLVSSFITAIIAALLLVEIISVLKLDRRTETVLTVISCFSIGLGAALTPVGEPLSTIVIDTKLNESFFYLLKLIGIYIIPAVVGLGLFAMMLLRRGTSSRDTLAEKEKEEGLKDVGIRGVKVYIFVMALVFLGTGFAPIIEWYIKRLGWAILYWVNTSSAILDNATLASAEIVPSMTEFQIIAALMALLIAGGMLIPGNIPNIIAAGKLNITSKDWARYGVPIGMVMMIIFFIILMIQSML